MSEQRAISTLSQLGAIVKFAKSGKPLVIDFRPIADRVTNDELRYITALDNVREVYLDGAPIEDDGLKLLLSLSKLSALDLQRTLITDDGLQWLSQIATLKLLLLTGSNVSLAGVREIRKSMIQTRIVFV